MSASEALTLIVTTLKSAATAHALRLGRRNRRRSALQTGPRLEI
jgi:hypothetical protein